MSADGSALIASAVQAAIRAKAPRRTVAAVAAAVAGAFVRPSTARATPTTGGKVSAGSGTQDAKATSSASPEELLEQLREHRRAQRRAKKARRKEAKATRNDAPSKEVVTGTENVKNVNSSSVTAEHNVAMTTSVSGEGHSTPRQQSQSRSLQKDNATAASPPRKAPCLTEVALASGRGGGGGVLCSPGVPIPPVPTFPSHVAGNAVSNSRATSRESHIHTSPIAVSGDRNHGEQLGGDTEMGHRATSPAGSSISCQSGQTRDSCYRDDVASTKDGLGIDVEK